MDTLITELCSFWKPENSVNIPSAVIHYLAEILKRWSNPFCKIAVLLHVIPYLWASVRLSLLYVCPNKLFPSEDKISGGTLLASLWALTFLDSFEPYTVPHDMVPLYVDAFETISTAEPYFSPSINALIKWGILTCLGGKRAADTESDDEAVRHFLEHAVFPSDTAIPRSLLERSVMELSLSDTLYPRVSSVAAVRF
jgi:hypothetical protein